jgi:hypothetical protein
LGGAKVLFDVLVSPVQECLDFDSWSFETGVSPIDVGFEVLTPWIPKDKSIFAQVCNIEWYSLFDVSSRNE